MGMEGWLHDLRYALRTLRRTPGFTMVAVLTLALGIGANTAIFSVIDGVLLRPVPFADADRLMMVWETDRNSGTTREPASVPDYLDFGERSTRFERLAAFAGTELNLTPDDGAPLRLTALAVTHEFLPLVGIEPRIGRSFTAAEDAPGGPHAVLISEDLWARLFARDPGVVGRTLRLDDVVYTVIGVLPSGADFGTLQVLGAAAYGRSFADRGTATGVDVWVPLQPDPESLPRSTHPIFVLGRLAAGASVAAAQQELGAIAAELEATYPVNDGRGVFIEPLTDVVFGPVRPALVVLLGAVALVLLVACVNVANLLLARGTTRVREVAVRTALGAGAGRLGRQFLVESVVLTLVAAAAGVGLAFAGLELLLALAPADIPRLPDVGIDARVLVATLVVSVLVGIAFGAVPTLQARRIDVQSALKGAGRGASAGRERRRLRSALVVAELALAVVLVAGAGLLIRSFWRLQQVDTGFRAEGVLKAEFQLPTSRYAAGSPGWPDFPEMRRFNGDLLRRVRALPGVESAAIAGNHPLDAGFTNSFVVVGREAEAKNWPEISIRRVGAGYFETVGLPLLSGRTLRDSDDAFATPVLIINQTAARRFFADRDPLGQQIAFWGAARTIVGVVADEHVHGLARPAPPAAYAPFAQVSRPGAEVLLLRTNGDPAALAPAVRRIVRELDPALAVYGVEPLAETVSRSIGQQRFTMALLAAFAALAIALAVIGVHGVLSYTVSRRTPEIGIRMALGASHGNVVGLVVGEGLRLALVGLALGIAGALAASRLLRSLLFGVTATDPATFAAVAAAILAAGALASWIPARRAARVDPMAALRNE
ncbi:MAG TPA: ABC transporter permease [Longimicrobiales bacterium]